jgi:phage baseplate assembly protein W
MAVVLGSKPIQDTEDFQDYGIGITLPLRIADVAFEQSYKTIDQVKTNIKSLLLSRQGERVMQPFLGSGLSNLVFDFNDEELATKIEETINESIQRWLPFVNIANIVIEQPNELKDQNRVNVSLRFTVGDSANLETVTFTA